jgi:hypothetical protein
MYDIVDEQEMLAAMDFEDDIEEFLEDEYDFIDEEEW